MDNNLKFLPDTIKPYIPPSDTTPEPEPDQIISGSDGISVYPNPFTDQLNIISEDNSAFDAIITDITGKPVASLSSAGQQLIWNGNDASSGIYFVRVVSGKGIATFKVIKQ